MVIGFLVGGGPVGAAIGAGIATPIGILAETTLANALVHDPRLRAQVEEATIGRYLFETLRNMGAALVAGYLGKYLEGLSKAEAAAVEGIIAGLLARLGSKFAGPTVEVSLYALLKKLVFIPSSVAPLWKISKQKLTLPSCA
jgi:hypothetical protein